MRIRSRLVLLSLGTLFPILAFSGFMLVSSNLQTEQVAEYGGASGHVAAGRQDLE
jgi:hypothetical protein